MPGQTKKSLAMLLAIGLILMGLPGCAPAGTEAGAPQNLNPTVVIVQYVTQVVATITPAPPTATPLPPTAQPARIGYDPYSVAIYFPLTGCQIASRLHVADRAVVGDTRNGTLALHMSANIGSAPIFRKLEPGEVLEVIGGPFCRDGVLVWEVMIGEEERGFVAEGDGNYYWLLPTGEEVDGDLIKEANKAMSKGTTWLGVPGKKCSPR